MRKFKVLESLSEFLKNTILTKDVNDMYYDERGEYCIDASIVENCPTVFEEIFENDWCIGSIEGGLITSIIRKRDIQRFKIGDNISLKDTRGWYIIDEFVIKDGELFIVETNEDGEDKHIINVLEELEGMSLEISSNKEELFELLQYLTDFYNKTFTKINNLIEK
jgi:hypothetical protein